MDYWEKSKHNPVLARPREGDENFGVYSVFDPDCWIENGMYYSVHGDKPLGGGKKPYDTVIEVFANRRQYFVERVYAPVDFDGISFHCAAHDSEIKNIKKWNMARA